MPASEGPAAIVMAAGKGTRMESELPKVLVEVRGRPMIEYVLDALRTAGVKRILVVVGYRAELVRERLAGQDDLEFVLQAEQLGTGHAVMVCREALADYDGPAFVVAGDSPMLRAESLQSLLEQYRREQPACLLGTAIKENPAGLGRIVRDQSGAFVGIVEQKDASEEQKQIREVNLSTYLFSCRDLFDSLEKIHPDNAQGEYYVTDCPRVLLDEGKKVIAWPGLHPQEAYSINNLDELAAVEELLHDE